MGIWFALICICILAPKISCSSEPSCYFKRNNLYAEQLTCTNVTSEDLENIILTPNRSNWFSCEQCNLTIISTKTLNFSRYQIRFLNLSNANIESIENNTFKNLFLLKVIFLRNNLISELDLKSLYSLKTLEQLDLSWNKLEYLQNDLFLDNKYLDLLNLNYNNINTFHPRAFNGLYNLKFLYLSGNDITYIQPYLFKYLINLRILYLEHNKLRELSPLAFTGLHQLNYLYLTNNSIEVMSDYNFKQLPNLIDLQLRENSLTEIVDSSFNGLKHLKFLYLGNNNITHIEEHGFVGLDSLLILDLMNNSLENFSIEHVISMPNLTTIWLENNTINTIIAPTSMDIQKNLQSIDLNINQLAYFNYKIVLSKFPALNELYLGENDWRCEFFVPMYDFFEENNVTLCLNSQCNKNDTIMYTENLCKLSFNSTDIESSSSRAFALDFLMGLVYGLYIFL